MTFTYKLNDNQIEILYKAFQNYQIESNNIYTLLTFKHEGNIITIYSTKKLMIQGKDITKTYNIICDLLHLEKTTEVKTNVKVNYSISSMGSDEVGTGDFFGPVVVCACYVNKENEEKLLQLGIRDSKQLTDETIIRLAPAIMENTIFSYRVLSNAHYNRLNYNLNEIKAIMHNFVMGNLYKKVSSQNLPIDLMVIDGFCTQTKYYEYIKKQENILKNVKLIPKAENSYTSVACGSILARYFFLKEMEKLSEIAGVTLPKGASATVDIVCSNIIKEKGIDFLNNIAKLNFKNFEKAKQYL